MQPKTSFVRTLITALIISGAHPVWAGDESLPFRDGPRPATTSGVPHVQIDVEEEPELAEQLLQRVAALPDVEIRETVVSLPGAKGFWLDDEIQLAHPEVIVGGREFAHIHPDGSLHASLPPELADEAVSTGWAVHHPWADQRPGWSGFVMIYTPTSAAELDVVSLLVFESYNFVTGRELAVGEE
jgi:hypothetical protein